MSCQEGQRSIVCFPFKEEEIDVVTRNLEIAAEHPAVAEILCIGFKKEGSPTWHAIETSAPAIVKKFGKPIVLRVQQRLGSTLRSGKGDGMNTALKYFIDETSAKHLHFYDADIKSFSSEWISGAEEAGDMDYDIVRHYFPRASTDAMITWWITKIGFAKIWPRSVLPNIEQPLGGELMLTRRAATCLLNDPRVVAQSDWGVDTLYTFVTAQRGLSVYENYVPAGKLHALYSGLSDIKTMLCECFSALQMLKRDEVPHSGAHCISPAEAVPEAVKEKVGYDFEKSLTLLSENWTPRQEELLREHFTKDVAEGSIAGRTWPSFKWATEEAWVELYDVLLEHFDKDDTDWKELFFRLWVARVLNYTVTSPIRGYDFAISGLRRVVSQVKKRSFVASKAEEAAKRMRDGESEPHTPGFSGGALAESCRKAGVR